MRSQIYINGFGQLILNEEGYPCNSICTSITENKIELKNVYNNIKLLEVNGISELFDENGVAYTSIEDFETRVTSFFVNSGNGESVVNNAILTVTAGVAEIDLSTTKSYADYTASEPFEIQIVNAQFDNTAELSLYPNGQTITIASDVINKGDLTMDATKQNRILFGFGAKTKMYNILDQVSYYDPQLQAPSVSLTGSTETSLTFGWSNIANNTDTEIQTSANGTTWSSGELLGADATSKTLSGLIVDTTRYVRVRYIGDGINYLTSNWSNIASGTTATNTAPTASDVLISCSPSDWQVGNTVSVSYIYNDIDGNSENTTASGTKYQIKAYDSEALANADTDNSSGTIAFSGYTGGSPSPNDIITAGMIGKYLKGFIQPVALSGGNPGVWTGSNVGSIIIATNLGTPLIWSATNKTAGFNITDNTVVGNPVPAYGVSDQAISNTQAISMRITAINNTASNGVLGLDGDSTLVDYTGFMFRVWQSSTSILYYSINNVGSVNTGHTLIVNEIIKIDKDGLYWSIDEGVNWTKINVGLTGLESIPSLYVKGYIGGLNNSINDVRIY